MRPLAAIVLFTVAAVVAAALWRERDDSAASKERAGVDLESLKVDTGRIVGEDGDAVLLRGFNVIPVVADDPDWTWGAEHYERIRDGGFNTVRFVMHWSAYEPERGRLDPRMLRSLDTAIGRARAAGLYVVLDVIHLFDGETLVPPWARTGDPLTAVERNGRPFVKAIAGRYRDDPAVVAIDPVNEPGTDPPDQDRILRMYRGHIDDIREVDRDAIVMFEPSFGDSSMAGANLKLLGDTSNLVFSMHDYYAGGSGAGYQPNGSQATAETGARYAWDGKTGYDEPSPAELEEHLDVNLRIMRKAGIPVWIGEFGMDPEAPNGRRWIRDKVALYERNGIGHAWWLYGVDGSLAPLRPDGTAFRDFVALLRPDAAAR